MRHAWLYLLPAAGFMGCVCQQLRAETPASPPAFVKGFTWGWTGSRGDYLGDAPDRSLKRLADTGTEWVILAFAAHMETKSTPEILYAKTNPYMVSDKEILRAIELARKHGLKVIMKPVVNCRDGTWRATIDFKSQEGWNEWWRNYEAFVLHYARIAAEAKPKKCEMLCIGCEMRSTEQFAKQWRGLIARVREVYDGPIMYNVNHGDEGSVEWWDAVDIIGLSGYWPVSTDEDTSLTQMLTSWKPVRERLRKLSERWNRPVLLAEIGVRSAKTCSTMPWDSSRGDLPYDGEEQARYYEAAFQSFANESSWFIGYCFWDWKARLYPRDDAAQNKDFCVYGKPAEAVLRKWYQRQWGKENQSARKAAVD